MPSTARSRRNQFVDLKWGTRNPIMLRDQEFGAVRLRAFGTYAVRINDAEKFMKEIMGTDGHFTVDEISNQLRNLIVTRFSGIVAQSGIPVLDMAGNYEQLGEYVTQKIAPEFNNYGVELTKILVENISLPNKVEEALDKRTSMGVIGNLDQYLQFQAAESLGKGEGNSTMDMGMGFAMANKMADTLQSPSQQNAQPSTPVQTQTPPPLPQGEWHVAINNTSSGPHNISAIADLIKTGQVNAATLVWKPGMQNWQTAAEVSELSGFFNPQTPPPLPHR